jgi:TRAP-type C4-dicarboxylate transport system permease small subunit
MGVIMWHKFSQFLARMLNVFCVFLLSAMTFVILLGVCFRYFLLEPLSWGEDVARGLMISLALYGVGVVMQKKSHVAVTLLVDSKKLPPRIRTSLLLIANILVLGFGLFMGYFGCELLASMRPQIIPTLNISMKWLYLGFPFYGFFLIVSTLDQIFEDIKQFRYSEAKVKNLPL